MDNYIKIGKLDKNKLGKYKNKITTNEVILTYERKQHIEERHNGDYNELKYYIKNVINSPNYILENHENKNTIILLKEILEKEIRIRIKMIIKLNTNRMEKKLNSIITFWKIRERDYNKTIKKSEIVYKMLDKTE